MYRYCVDNAVTYSPEDIVLFRESPFASWMERLTLENPDHGIAADSDIAPAELATQRQHELAEVLRAEKRHVEVIDPEAGEPERRTATLGAMRSGVDFIISGQLAVGPLSGPANLLMRTSGYSELGNFLYLPCDTAAKTTLHSAFRLCFLADLLHSLQGQLPPQMLVIRSGSDLLPLRTEDHIYHYLAVKQRFMRAMAEFRKHRMPDPSESVHFGRWSQCAHEVLRKRALRAEQEQEAAALAETEDSGGLVVEEERSQQEDRASRAELGSLAAPFARARVYAPDAVPPAARTGGERSPAGTGGAPPPSLGGVGYLERLNFIGNQGPDEPEPAEQPQPRRDTATARAAGQARAADQEAAAPRAGSEPPAASTPVRSHPLDSRTFGPVVQQGAATGYTPKPPPGPQLQTGDLVEPAPAPSAPAPSLPEPSLPEKGQREAPPPTLGSEGRKTEAGEVESSELPPLRSPFGNSLMTGPDDEQD